MNPKETARLKRKQRIKKKIGGGERFRLSVFRSSKHIYAQIVDDGKGQTLAAASTLSGELKDQLSGLKKSDAAKAVGKPITNLRVVVNGAGAAGYAVTKLLLCLGIDKKICTSVKEILVCDSRGAIYEGRPDLNPYKRELASYTNGAKKKGTLGEVLEGADVFIGVSTAHVLTKEMIQKMAKDPIVFAMANPTPEIMPEQAIGVAKVFGTGRSDFPNQINNSLAFPGVFRGALDARARKINSEMKIAAANAIASYVPHPTIDNILPHTLDKAVHKAVAAAVKKAAIESGVGHT